MESDADGVLDPFKCIAKKNQKYASECTEVYLANQNATSLSKDFHRFSNLEVVWFNGNRLTRLDNLEENFRIREVHVHNNRLVSLSGLQSFKFLRVLLASNNRIRNLDKQLHFLAKFACLEKVELFGNPMAEEPEYRNRMIYHLKQVSILDRHVVTDKDRIRAEEVVPALDQVSAPKSKTPRATSQRLSKVERDCFMEKRAISARRKKVEEEALNLMFTGRLAQNTEALAHKTFRQNKQAWSNTKSLLDVETIRPTAWESIDMVESVTQMAGKRDLTRDDVTQLCVRLSQEGVADYGRTLTNPMEVFADLPLSATPTPGEFEPRKSIAAPKGKKGQEPPPAAKPAKGKAGKNAAPKAEAAPPPALARQATTRPETPGHPLEALATLDGVMSARDVAKHLVTLEWHRQDNDTMARRIEELNERTQSTALTDDTRAQSACQTAALRLETIKSRREEVAASANREKERECISARKTRGDFFITTFIRPRRLNDDLTGRQTLSASSELGLTSLGG